ncbi:phage head-tail adapter protein [Pandoraea faecigallinarum]|uniref:Phage head-tail adapter protein n=1 Tax=Pandoraea faecigallinarum TaxID=656179 RepID=A0A0H3WRV2_9BURK|nr:gpW family head-tail joining protein [Pandoraea faecigallinarum]AKM29271.1 phage head-tail adapter protein [Pandoraea faecigallinarum]
MFNPNTSIFAGMPTAAVQQALANAQAALIQLQSGQKGVSFSYAQGDGTKSVTYQQADIAALTALIRQLQQQLGIIPRARRSFRFVYR